MIITPEVVNELRSTLLRLSDRDLSHDELGINGFQDAEASKVEILEYLGETLDRIDQHIHALNKSVLESSVAHINKVFSQIDATANGIDKLAGAGVHQQPSYPQLRDQHNAEIRALADQVQGSLFNLDLGLRMAAVESAQNTDESFVLIRKKAETALQRIQVVSKEATKVLSNVQDNIAEKGVEEVAGGFTELANSHKKREGYWFRWFGVASSAALIAVGWALFGKSPEAANLTKLAPNIFRHVLAISTPALFMKVALSKYNLERNLRIVYEHRRVVLNQYKTFEAAIGEDQESKNRLRLEIAKYIFSDPVTGYVTADAAAELNFNPIISGLERAAP